MKKRLLILLGIFAMGYQLMGSNAQDVLRRAREDYYRQEKERAAAEAKAQREATRGQRNERPTRVSSGETVPVEVGEDGTVTVNVGEGEYPTLQREKEPKPRNQMERLERTAAKATDRVDFYERVVRSVAREETDLKKYNAVLGKKKTNYDKVPEVAGVGK